MRHLFLAVLFLPLWVQAQFWGSIGRGDAAAIFQSTPLMSSIYTGGIGRGDASALYQVMPLLSNNYGGGIGRGDASAVFANTTLANIMYHGGIGRGDVAALWQMIADDDADGDGVVDASDLCPSTPTGEAVNTDGCSCAQLPPADDGDPCTLDECNAGIVTHTFQDTDVDGVCDAGDACPGTTGGELVNAQGCDCGVYPLDDGSECTVDYCFAGVVTHTLVDDNNNGICDLLESGDAWTPTQDFVDGRAGAVSFTIGDTAYMGTGFNGGYLNDFYARDPVTGTWLPRENVPGPGRQGAVAFTLNGKGYVGTGSFDDPNPELALADFHEYDPATGHWTTIEVFPFPVKYATAFSIGGKGYVATGISGTDKLTTLVSYEPGPGWISSVPLGSDGRAYASSFVIGDRAYVFGGDSDNGRLNDLWSFDETNGWLPLGYMPDDVRSSAMAFTIGNGGFIAGGWTTGNTPLDELWEYNPFTNEWYARAPLVGGPRHYGTSFTLGQTAYVGTGYVGGVPVSSFEQYTPPPPDCQGVPGGNAIPGSSCEDGLPATVNDAWTSSCVCEGHVPSDEWLYRGTAASNARYGAVSFTIGDVAYFGGGADANGALFDFHRYDPVNGWAAIDPIPGGPRIYAVAFSSGGKGYVGTGSDNNFYEYDPATGWHQLDNPLPGPVRAYATAFTISDEGYVGLGQTVGPVTYLRDFYKFVPGQDPGSGVWEPIEDFPAHQAWLNGEFYDTGIAFATGFSVGGNGYVCCGAFDNTNNEFFQPLNELWAYTPGIGWVAKAPLPFSNRLLATGFSIGDKGYVGTGLSFPFNTLNDDFYEYDPVADVWTQRATYSGGPRQNASGFSISGMGYIVGGQNAQGIQPDDLWEYTPPVTCVAGTPCDLDPCLLGETLDANCVCSGGVPDLTDDDMDGVLDCSDNCPGTQTGEIPNESGCGCSQINWDDGLPCTQDDCINGIVYNTPMDSDGDGIDDCTDTCPYLFGENGDACGGGPCLSAGIIENCACTAVPINQPPGDAYATAIPITLDNSGLATVNGNSQLCFTSTYTGPHAQASPDVWYSLNTGACASGTLTLSTCAAGSLTDTYLHVLDANGTSELAFNDDIGSSCTYSPYRSALSLAVTPNTIYIIVVEGYSNTAPGTFTLSVSVPQGNCGADCLGVVGGTDLPGTSCDDNNECTVNDLWSTSCVCAGTFLDSDNDGLCDAQDPCPLLPPSPMDAFSGAYDITGNIGFGFLFGQCATNDYTPTSTPGDPSASADNDLFLSYTTGNCVTALTLRLCNAPVLHLLDAAGNHLAIGNGQADPVCSYIGANGTGSVIDNFPVAPNTTYIFVLESPNNDFEGVNLGISPVVSPDTDGDGICDASDNCPNVAGQIGSSCDDGNANTSNDLLNADCVCTGEPSCIPPGTLLISGSVPICTGTFFLGGDILQGTGPFTYSWTGPGIIANPQQQSTSVEGLDGTNSYSLTVTNACGSSVNSISISLAPLISQASVLDESCPGAGDGSIAIQTLNNVTGIQYQWQIPTECSSGVECPANFFWCEGGHCSNPLAQQNMGGLSPGTYIVTASSYSFGCSSTRTYTVGTNTLDTDADGVLDCLDNCPNVYGQIGSSCDDGSASTINDILRANCTCFGTLSLPEISVEQPAGNALSGVVAWGSNWAGETTVPAAAQTGVTAVSAGKSHTLALKSDGSVIAWGNNTSGQTNVPATAQSGIVAISAGEDHSLALKSDGSVIAWGWNDNGQTSVPIEAQSGVTAIAAGRDHTVALKSDGSVIAWGDNSLGQTSVPIEAQSGVTAIAAGRDHTVALKSDGRVIEWGLLVFPQPVPVEALSGVVSIAAGWGYTVALKTNGSVIVWGLEYGSLPVPLEAQAGITAIAAGGYRTLALKTDGSVIEWSYDDGLPQPLTPVPMEAQNSVGAIAAGFGHNQVLKNGLLPVGFSDQTVSTTSTAKTFTIRNTGNASLTGLAITKTGVNPGDFTVNTDGMLTTVPPGGSTAFSVTFTPASTGARSATLHIASNDNNENPYDIELTGNGVAAPNVQLALKVILEGPYNSATGLMGDNLRTLPSFALTEPFTALGYAHLGGGGGETTTTGVLAVTGNDAIVDWVLLELRSTADPATILASRSALVQRDGDVVDVDGTSPVSFSIAPGDFHVAVRHRNHLGCMTAGPVSLSASPASVDFTTLGTATYGTNARKTSSGAVSVQMLWAGDVTFNGVVKYTGSGNDRDPILIAVGSTTPNNVISTYSTRDVNLNGQVKYTGSGNDRDPILVNVGSTTPNNIRVQQLP